MVISDRIKIGDWIAYGCILLAALVPFSDSLNPIALYGAIPIAFLWCFSRYSVCKANPTMHVILALYIWLCVCALFAIDWESVNRELRSVLGAFILCYAVGALALRDRLLPLLYGVYIVLLISAWLYAKDNILNVIDFGEQRLNDSKLNANTLAYYTFYVTVAIYMLGELLKGTFKTIFRYLLFLMIVVSFITAIYTGSRQVLLIQVPLLAFLIWCRYLRKSVKNIAMLLGVFLLAVVLFMNFGAAIYENSTLKKRSEVVLREDSRVGLVGETIELGMQRPLFGYGPGCVHKVTKSGKGAHNSFLELFVNTGFIGALIFWIMIYRFLKLQYRRWKYTKDRMFLAFLLFGFIWLADQMFFSFYADLWLMSFFVLVAAHSERYYKSIS